MDSVETIGSVDDFFSRVGTWDVSFIPNSGSSYTVGRWVARLTGPAREGGRYFCNLDYSEREYTVIFFKPNKAGETRNGEVIEKMVIKKDIERIKTWLTEKEKLVHP